MLVRLLAMCLTSVVMVLGGNALLALPQIREGLWAFDDGTGDEGWRQVAFVMAFLYWAVTAWYVARLTLGRRFPHDSVGSSEPFVHAVAKWLPRLLGLAACLPVALFLLGTGKHSTLAWVLVAASLLFLVFTWRRRAIFDLGGECGYYRYFDCLRPASWHTLLIGFAVPHVVLILIMIWPITVPRAVGAPALMLLAMGSWTLVGGILLSYWPRTAGGITMGWVPPLLLWACSFGSDHHPVDWHAGPRTSQGSVFGKHVRLDLKDHYEAWMKRRPSKEPIFLVASAGGASRASYWGGVLLGRLEDEARAERRRFGSNIFMMSGISGGSVGMAAFAAALRAWPEPGPTAPLAATGCIRLAMDKFLGADVLAPVGALMLYPDLLLSLLPSTFWAQHFDRSRGLEAAWVSDWRALMAQPPTGCAKPAAGAQDLWAQPLTQALKAVPDQPTLVLNTARLEDSRRVLQSNVRLELRDAEDLLGAGFESRVATMSLAAVAHNSARFPLVSPPGSVRTAHDEPWGHLGDGGYHEVTGAATLADVVEALIDLGCLQRVPSPTKGEAPVRLVAKPRCEGGAIPSATEAKGRPDAGSASSAEARVVIVLIHNTPTDFPVAWQRDLGGHQRTWSAGERTEVMRVRQTLRPIEVLGPIFGLVTHSSQEARSAQDKLAALAGTDLNSVIELRFPRYLGLREPSMNWQLDRYSRSEMMCAAESVDRPARPVLSTGTDEHACSGDASAILPRQGGQAANLADAALLRNLQRLRNWIHHVHGEPAPERSPP
jgi:hypothetical protein